MEVENGPLEDEFSKGPFSTSIIMGGRVTVPTPPHLILPSLFLTPQPLPAQPSLKADVRATYASHHSPHMAWDVGMVGSPPDPQVAASLNKGGPGTRGRRWSIFVGSFLKRWGTVEKSYDSCVIFQISKRIVLKQPGNSEKQKMIRAYVDMCIYIYILYIYIHNYVI